MMRKYGLKVELARNSEANRTKESHDAGEVLRQLAADPKLTVVWQRSEKVGGKRAPIILCKLKRPIVGILVRPSTPSEAGSRPFFERLYSVDVEPVLYSKAELPGLISEIAAVQRDNSTSPFSVDLSELLAALRREGPPESDVVFY